jgi:hypothetical protein
VPAHILGVAPTGLIDATDLWPAGEQRALHATNETELRRQLAANSIVDELAQSVFDQLEKGDTAHVEIPRQAHSKRHP